MKRKIIAVLAALSLSSGLVYASNYNSVDVTVGEGREMTMIGSVLPSIVSVTIPTTVPFDMSKNLSGENKAVSPVVPFRNNSASTLYVSIRQTTIDISKFPGTAWSDDGVVYENDNSIAVGFMRVTSDSALRPTDIEDNKTTWLIKGAFSQGLVEIPKNSSKFTYVVGKIGKSVPETGGTNFTVVPTFVVTTTTAGLSYKE